MIHDEKIRVRIAVIVDAIGNWAARSSSEEGDKEKRQLACDDMFETDRDNHIVWIEAPIPLPNRTLIEGEVKSEEPTHVD